MIDSLHEMHVMIVTGRSLLLRHMALDFIHSTGGAGLHDCIR